MSKQVLPLFSLPPSFFAVQQEGIAASTTTSHLEKTKALGVPNQGFSQGPTPYPLFLAAVHTKIGVGAPQQQAQQWWPQQAWVALSSIAFSLLLGSALFLAKQNPLPSALSTQSALSSSERSLLLSQKEEILMAFSDSDPESLTEDIIADPASPTTSDPEFEVIISELDLNEI